MLFGLQMLVINRRQKLTPGRPGYCSVVTLSTHMSAGERSRWYMTHERTDEEKR